MQTSSKGIALVVAVLAAGCMGSSRSVDGNAQVAGQGGGAARGGDGFAVGTAALLLEPAPAGLCEGGGADKECGPDGCAETPPPTGAPSGASAPTAGGAAPAPAPSFGSAAGSGWDNSSAPPSTEPMDTATTGGAPASAVDAGPPATVDAGCAETQDAGALQCSDAGADAGVAQAQAALIADDVPGCAMIEAGTPSTLFMSADDSNSMAGPVIARRLIRGGQSVPSYVVRPWEFLNYYDLSFEPAEPGQVRIVPQLSSCPQNDRLSLQVALSAEARDPAERAPITLTLVLDTSGSMGGNTLGGATPIELERASIVAMASRLRQGDIVSAVTWSTVQDVLLSGHEVSGPDDPELLQLAAGLSASGGTDLHAGLVRGYELAEQHHAPDRINRVVLISDGIANVGVTDETLIAQYSDDEEGDAGIYLAGIGVGDGFNDTLMNAVTDAGRGAYVYLDSLDEAGRMLGERFLQVVDLAARDVRLEVTLPYHLVLEEFFGEVASTDAAKVRPQHLGPNDAMLFFQVLRACDPSLLRGDDRIRLRATWQTPFEREQREAVIDTTLNALAGNDDDLTKAAAIAAYAEALIEASSANSVERAQILQGALSIVRAAKNADSDPDLLEVAELLEQYAALGAP